MQVAEAIAQSIIPNGRVWIDVFRTCEPCYGGALIPKLIDELERDPLASGEDAPIRDTIETGIVKLPARLNEVAEPSIGIQNDGFYGGTCFRRGGVESIGRSFQGTRFYLLHPDAQCLEKVAHVGILKQYPDRADQRGLLRDDVIAGKRCDIAAGRRETIDN